MKTGPTWTAPNMPEPIPTPTRGSRQGWALPPPVVAAAPSGHGDIKGSVNKDRGMTHQDSTDADRSSRDPDRRQVGDGDSRLAHELDEESAHDATDEDEDDWVEETGEDDPNPDFDDVFGDLEDLAERLLSTWVSDGELSWAKYAWHTLQSSGLTTPHSTREHARVVCRLVALSELYRRFAWYAWGEGSLEPFGRLGEAVGEYPAAHPFWLGVLAAEDGFDIEPVEEDHDFAISTATEALVEQEYTIVRKALIDSWGENELFASMWISPRFHRHPSPRDPSDYSPPGGDAVRAWLWISDGMLFHGG
jgi:hypothetical protein